MKTYRLSINLTNPVYDKRCGTGVKSVPMIKAGTLFEGMPTYVNSANGGVTPAYVRCKDWYAQGEVAALVIGNSFESAPETWREIAICDGDWSHFADEVLDQLLADELVTVDQVRNTLNKCLNKEPA
jgi:hypothetical protein